MENTNKTMDIVANSTANNTTVQAFNYTYSSEQQREIERITKKYMPKQEDKMEQLRRLDRSCEKKGQIASIATGTISSLVMGAGMSMCMVGSSVMMIPGIIIGIVGMIGVGVAYPIYSHITKKEREKNAPMILKLAEEIAQ